MEFAQQISIAILLLALLAGLAWQARRRGLAQFGLTVRSQRVRRMEVLERLTLTPHHSLHLVTVDSRTVLVGVSPGGCQLLEKPEEPSK